MLLVLLLLSVVSAHVCLLNPMQRGGANINQPGSGSCFRSKGPCGGIASQTPNVTLTAGMPYSFLIQQNLNHYSIGNRGWIDIAIADTPNPTSDGQFEVIAEYPDYDAYHQWSQTNMTLTATLPNFTCPHAVIRIRYIPRKPTEPIFYQCADVIVAAASLSEPPRQDKIEIPPLNLRKKPSSPAAFNPTLLGMRENPPSGSVLFAIDPVQGVATEIAMLDSYVEASHHNHRHADPKAPVSGAWFADEVIGVDSNKQVVYYLKSQSFEELPSILYGISYPSGNIVLEQVYNTTVPLSGIHISETNGAMIAFGLHPNTTDNSWRYVAGVLDLSVNPGEFRAAMIYPTDVAPYVDYAWSDYDSGNMLLYIFTRHEDQPVTLNAQLFTFNYNTMASTMVNLALNWIYSSFVIDTRTPNTLLAFSPGPVDSNGNVPNPVWSLVQINTLTGGITVLSAAPATLNQYPVWWGGGVAGFTNSPAVTTQETIAYHFLGLNVAPNPQSLLGFSVNLTNLAWTIYPQIPFFYNLVQIA